MFLNTVMEPDRTTSARDVHFSNAPLPISVTESGIAIRFSDVHPWKADPPILVTDSGIVMLFNDAHPRKASSPILVTRSGISQVPSRMSADPWINSLPFSPVVLPSARFSRFRNDIPRIPQ